MAPSCTSIMFKHAMAAKEPVLSNVGKMSCSGTQKLVLAEVEPANSQSCIWRIGTALQRLNIPYSMQLYFAHDFQFSI